MILVPFLYIHLPLSSVFAAPVRQRPPIRIFKSFDSKNEFVPIIYYQSFETPSTICANSWAMSGYNDQNVASYMCSLYGAPVDDDDMTYDWSNSSVGWENWGADYYTGNNSQNGMDPMMGMGMGAEVGSVDVLIPNTNTDSGDSMDMPQDWMITATMDQMCLDQTNTVAIKCGASDFCLESGESCATDLDCCQTPEKPMFCFYPEGYCVHTV